ncbi:MAG: hypothetical protein AB1429_17625 [Pseudomonadota bacterium]|jgi:uncharacterized phiE125 gp8 family phage protein
MMLSVLTPPAVEPVSLDALKAELRATSGVDDALIAALGVAARQRVESELGLALLATGFRQIQDGFAPATPLGAILLARGPLISVQAIAVADQTAAFHALDPPAYRPQVGSLPSEVGRTAVVWRAPTLQSSGVRIDYTAGFGTDPGLVPAPLVQAILALAAFAYTHRAEAAVSGAPQSLIEPWLAPWRKARL